ncbi:hypothetical protein [Gordonia sp. SL306]|uniref:hypothetical protein n=1 Tax=Gordonia sp. SL306 TaxID=2995145 RepID=UPI00226FCF4B|nr:hypothetical protein [Gordonia sp. SL306]WAC54827.1 hypothetical protein OVA31_19575 [Gordonia sp. SL306]
MKRAHRGPVAALAAAGIAMVVICGCGGSPAVTGEAAPRVNEHVPADLDITFRWLPGPVLDLFGPEGTFVRAYIESFELADAGRSTTWGYHGFVAASPSNIDSMIAAYPPDVSPDQPGVGTAIFTGLRRVDDGDWTRIVLCRHGFRSVRDDAGNGSSWTSRTDAPRPVEVDFRRVGAGPPNVKSGTQRTPDGAVFGDWRATRVDFAAIYPTPTADQNACAAMVSSGVPQRAPTHGGQPWPSLAPSPGWSATSLL